MLQVSTSSVLIVDDELIILQMLRDVLTEEGFEVLTANNGRTALNLLQQTPVAVVLTDLMMPQMGGVELAHHLRNNQRTAKIPVILMSAALPITLERIFASIIQKPFSLDEVIQQVRQFSQR